MVPMMILSWNLKMKHMYAIALKLGADLYTRVNESDPNTTNSTSINDSIVQSSSKP